MSRRAFAATGEHSAVATSWRAATSVRPGLPPPFGWGFPKHAVRVGHPLQPSRGSLRRRHRNRRDTPADTAPCPARPSEPPALGREGQRGRRGDGLGALRFRPRSAPPLGNENQSPALACCRCRPGRCRPRQRAMARLMRPPGPPPTHSSMRSRLACLLHPRRSMLG